MQHRDLNQFRCVPLELLPVGAMLEYPIYDDRGDQEVLLVSGGSTLTADLLNKLHARGITDIRVADQDLQQMGVVPADDADFEANKLPAGLTPDSHFHNVKQHGAVSYDPETIRQLEQNYEDSLNQVGNFFEALSGDQSTDPDVAKTLSSTNVSKLTEDLDLFTALGLGDKADKYPYRHSLQTMMLAASVGTTLGLTRSQLTDLGMGCLLHDAGMMMIDRRVWQKRGRLSDWDRFELSKHPNLAFDRVNRCPKVPNGARMVVFQMHERMNGTGYPRQRTGRQIYPLSRIAMVADVFVAMISPRPHRPALMPYQAMEQIILQARSRLLDPKVVRGLLKTVSLFPITSLVVMSDGRVGKVIRSTGDTYTRPILDLWPPDDTDAEPETVDLTVDLALEIKRPLTKFEAEELGLVQTARAI